MSFFLPKRHGAPRKNSINPKTIRQLNQKTTFIQVDLPVQISDLWASLDTDGDGRVRMEVRISPTRRGRDGPPVTDQTRLNWGIFHGNSAGKQMGGEAYFLPENERLFHIFPL